MGGNLQAYAIYLERTYGQGVLQELEREKRKVIKNFDFEGEIKKRKALLAELEK